jgi:hypothetical protein
MSPQAPTVFAPINQVLATANNKAAKQKATKQKATKQKATEQQSNSKGTSCHRVRLSTSSSLTGELHDDDF